MDALALADVEREAKGCVACPLAATRTQVVFGVGDPSADLMFVGEGPGRHEDEQGIPFVGKAGQLLTRLIGEIGLTRDDVYIANVVKCRPPGNRDPLPAEIDACSPWLQAQLDLVRPLVVVPLGNFASRLLLATKEGITRTRGKEYPWRDALLVPTFHPSAVLRGGGDMLARVRADMVVVERALRRRRAERDAATGPGPAAGALG